MKFSPKQEAFFAKHPHRRDAHLSHGVVSESSAIQVDQNGVAGPQWLRPPDEARLCKYLDTHKLSNEEAKGMEEIAFKLQTNCRGCTGNTLLQRCHQGEAGVQGFTTISHCSNKCTLFEKKQ